MYQMMGGSRIVFNRHIDAAATYANNLRLYEVTGSGSLLLTDWKTKYERGSSHPNRVRNVPRYRRMRANGEILSAE